MSDFEGRLKAESTRYLALLEKLGEKLSKAIDTDVNEEGTPSRDFARVFGHYSGGVRGLLGEQRERLKLQLLADKAGQRPLSDEEYEAGLRSLALEAVKQLPEAELRAELEARGIEVPEVDPVDD